MDVGELYLGKFTKDPDSLLGDTIFLAKRRGWMFEVCRSGTRFLFRIPLFHEARLLPIFKTKDWGHDILVTVRTPKSSPVPR